MKKAAFIGHYFHKKTGSSKFFQDYLETKYTLNRFDFDPDNVASFDAEDLLSEDYDLYVFWQSEQIAAQLYHRLQGRILIVPMYDAVHNVGPNYWQPFPRAIFLSFSSRLHARLQASHSNSIHVQYSPIAKERHWSADNGLSGYFWERRPEEDYNAATVIRICADLGIPHLHIHLAPDFKTSNKNRRNFLSSEAQKLNKAPRLTFSDWYPSKEQAIAESQRHPIYFAARPLEGIGMSFLEAMAHGQVVIGPDEATLNEYVADGITGYLLGDDYTLPLREPLSIDGIFKMSDAAMDAVSTKHKNWMEGVQRLDALLERGFVLNDMDSGSCFERELKILAGRRQ